MRIRIWGAGLIGRGACIRPGNSEKTGNWYVNSGGLLLFLSFLGTDPTHSYAMVQALEKVGLKWSMLATTSWESMFDTLSDYVKTMVGEMIYLSFRQLQ